jgi:hypothetical protein
MSSEAAPSRKCVRCGTTVDSCAFCDEPDCPAITCYRCVVIGFLDRLRPKSTSASPTGS